MRKLSKLVVVLLVLSILFSASACGKSGEKQYTGMDLDSLIKNSKNADNISLEIEGNYTVPGVSTIKGKIWINGDKIKQEIDAMGYFGTVYIDKNKKIIMTYMKDQKAVTRQTLTDDFLTNNSPFGIINDVTENDLKNFKKISPETVENKKCMVFEGISKDMKNATLKNAGFTDLKYKMYFQEDTGIMSKCEIRSADKIITTLQMKSIKTGNVTEDMVKVDIPENIEITDIDATKKP